MENYTIIISPDAEADLIALRNYDRISRVRIDMASVSELTELLEKDAVIDFDFDEVLWRAVVEKVVVRPDRSVIFQVFAAHVSCRCS